VTCSSETDSGFVLESLSDLGCDKVEVVAIFRDLTGVDLGIGGTGGKNEVASADSSREIKTDFVPACDKPLAFNSDFKLTTVSFCQ